MPIASGARSRHQHLDKVKRVERCADLGVVVKIDIDIPRFALCCTGRARARTFGVAALCPSRNALGPNRERAFVIAAGVELFGAVEPAIDEVRRHIHQKGPFDGVGHHEPDAIFPEQRDEFRYFEAVVADFECMPKLAVRAGAEPGARFELRIVTARQPRRRMRVARQKIEEGCEFARIEPHLRRQLPQDRTKLVLQPEHARREEIRKRRLCVFQLEHMGNEAWPFESEDEIVRCLFLPLAEQLRALKRIKCAVDFDGREGFRRECQFVLLAQIAGIEHAAPARIAPTRYADAHRHKSRKATGKSANNSAQSSCCPSTVSEPSTEGSGLARSIQERAQSKGTATSSTPRRNASTPSGAAIRSIPASKMSGRSLRSVSNRWISASLALPNLQSFRSSPASSIPMRML